MTALVRSELLKIRTTRSWWGYLGTLVLLVGLATAAEVGSREELEQVELVSLADLAGITSLLAIILGITIVTAEFRHGTITPTLLATPKRGLVLAGKAISGTAVTLLFVLLAFLVVTAVALTWSLFATVDFNGDGGEVAGRAAKVALGVVLWLLLGVAIGVAVQGQVAALVGTLVWIFLVETLLIGALGLVDWEGVRKYLPFQALDGADGVGGDELLSYWPAVGVSLAWIALIGAFGAVRLARRDIT
jgi:ABC-2 type transport system permease protein